MDAYDGNDASGVAGMDAPMMEMMPPGAMAGCSDDGNDATCAAAGMDAPMMEMMPPAAMAGMDAPMMEMMPPAAMAGWMPR